MTREYGGYLPFELPKGKEYFDYDESQMQKYNSGKTAILFAIKQSKAKRIWVPTYLCPGVKRTIIDTGLEVKYYNVGFELEPIGLELVKGDALFLVNYFGVKKQKVEQYFDKDVTIIIDNSHSFFEEAVFHKQVYNVYSCKKFFGVPDGAYLIGDTVEVVDLDEMDSLQNCDYLLGSLIEGTNRWYARKKEVDLEIKAAPKKMSSIAQRVLESIDYKYVIQRRKENYQMYCNEFGAVNKIKVERDAIPYVYPLNVGVNIKKQLVEKKIYVSTLWSDTLEEEFYGTDEYKLSDETIFLPVDQRYDAEDIRYIIDSVNEVLK